MNYFLSDKSVEVKEINEQNSGRHSFPMLLRRQKLAKKPLLTHCPGMSLKKEEFYEPEDMLTGKQVDIYGRICTIYDCDDFTKQWYQVNLGHNQLPLQLKKGRPNITYQPVPPYNGYGTPEDSMGSVHSLQPKPPRMDI